MFSHLSERLKRTVKNLTGRGYLNEDNIRAVAQEVRRALIEADVALPVVKTFVSHIEEKALGQRVMDHLNPGQALIKIVHDELVGVMGHYCDTLNMAAPAPLVILMVGLQGSGKTTTAAKLANLLKKKHHKKIMMVSTDIYRPAAIQQLEQLAQQVAVDFFPSHVKENPVDVALRAVQAAKSAIVDVLIVDTAGRLHIDDVMMHEIKSIHAAIHPAETLFVVDSMTGQDAANTARAFDTILPSLTGVILTKTDGDARGGAALSIREITKKPIKFIGTGEKIEALEPFYPDRMASRILGMGDVLTLIEEVEEKIDKSRAKIVAKKMKKGSFNLEDFRKQLQQMQQMGGAMGILGKLPGLGNLQQLAQSGLGEDVFSEIEVIINSMTMQERCFPDLVKNSGSRKRRIGQGSGKGIQAVGRLLKRFEQMQKMMKKFSNKTDMASFIRHFKGKIPPGIL